MLSAILLYEMIKIESPDLSACIFARKILIQQPKVNLGLFFGKKWNINGEPLHSLWERLLTHSLTSKTRFGRIGVTYDHHNKEASSWAQSISKDKTLYNPKDKRALESPEFHIFPTQILAYMSNEGLADTVEFRRIARKVIRKMKQANIDTLLLLDPILGETKTQKILQHIAGKQLQIISPVDVFDIQNIAPNKQQSLTIESPFDKSWTYKRCESILKQKLKK